MQIMQTFGAEPVRQFLMGEHTMNLLSWRMGNLKPVELISDKRRDMGELCAIRQKCPH